METQFRKRWDFLATQKDFMEEMVKIHKFHIHNGGCVVWMKFNNDNQVLPDSCGIPRTDFNTWNIFQTQIPNFELLEKDYNPSEHILMMMSFGGMQQIVRVNIDSTSDDFVFELS